MIYKPNDLVFLKNQLGVLQMGKIIKFRPNCHAPYSVVIIKNICFSADVFEDDILFRAKNLLNWAYL
jgi:hypothetical protein